MEFELIKQVVGFVLLECVPQAHCTLHTADCTLHADLSSDGDGIMLAVADWALVFVFVVEDNGHGGFCDASLPLLVDELLKRASAHLSNRKAEVRDEGQSTHARSHQMRVLGGGASEHGLLHARSNGTVSKQTIVTKQRTNERTKERTTMAGLKGFKHEPG